MYPILGSQTSLISLFSAIGAHIARCGNCGCTWVQGGFNKRIIEICPKEVKRFDEMITQKPDDID